MNYTKKGRGVGIYADNAVYVGATNTTSSTFAPGALYVAYGGTVVVETAESENNTTVTIGNVQAGSVLPILVQRVHSTGTTATGFIVLY